MVTRLHVEDLHAIAWGEGPWALVTPVKANGVSGFWKIEANASKMFQLHCSEFFISSRNFTTKCLALYPGPRLQSSNKQSSLAACYFDLFACLRILPKSLQLPKESIFAHGDEWCETWQQCDQIWQNFATLAQFEKSWVNYEGSFSIWLNVNLTLSKMLCYWASFRCCL